MSGHFENLNNWFTVYIILINIVGLIITGFDKYRAIHKKWRVPERRFFVIAILGGGLGVYSGCLVFNHKTQKRKFMIGIPVICIIEAAIFFLL